MKANELTRDFYNQPFVSSNPKATLHDTKESANLTDVVPVQPSIKITLSEAAKVALNKSVSPSFEEAGMSARAKLDALKQQASEKTGIPVASLNVQQAGLIDYSSFTDQELAAMALNSSKNFSEAERVNAGGALTERVRVSLEAYSNQAQHFDRRGHAMAINALYEKMSPEVRTALNWTPAMMTANNQMLEGDEKRLGKISLLDVLANLKTASQQGGLAFQ